MSYLIADSRAWRPEMARNLERRVGARFHSIRSAAELTPEKLAALDIERAFFPHWSERIPEAVYSRIDCVVFHMTDLPFGRGGSPLQNLIVRGIGETKVSAIKCTAGLDEGPVYLKRPLGLEGSAQEIFVRASAVIEDMIVEIIEKRPEPQAQSGTPTVFKRRTPEQGNIGALATLREVYDYIRMLDAEGYPHAFVETDTLRLEFSRAKAAGDEVTAHVTLKLKRNKP